MKYNILKNNKGYTLLFAVLVSSIVLAVGISILTISKKEFLLSSSARDSIIALYSADSGLECAIYNINSNPAEFSTTTQNAYAHCINKDFNTILPPSPTDVLPITFNGTDTFTFNLKTSTDSAGQACAIITVRKYYIVDIDLGYIPLTTIVSKGYNLGWTGPSPIAPLVANTCSAPSPRRVERALEYTF